MESERRRNPVPYMAHYFGEKVHIDQNENLVMLGTMVSVFLVQSNSNDIGNEKNSKKFNFQFFEKLKIEFSLETNFQFSILLVEPWA